MDELTPMNFDEFKNFLDQEISQGSDEDQFIDDDEIIPLPISLDDAFREAKAMLDDFTDEKEDTVMVVFEFKNGYQVDVISNHPEFEIYDHLYDPCDIAYQVYWDPKNVNEKKVVDMK